MKIDAWRHAIHGLSGPEIDPAGRGFASAPAVTSECQNRRKRASEMTVVMNRAPVRDRSRSIVVGQYNESVCVLIPEPGQASSRLRAQNEANSERAQ
jgi:hypothetical protein